ETPAQFLGKQASQNQPSRCAAGSHSAPSPKRTITLWAFLEGRCQKRQCRWRDQGAGKALDQASGDQHSAGLAESAQHRCRDEEDQTRHKYASPADDVSQPTAQHEKAAKGERVAT